MCIIRFLCSFLGCLLILLIPAQVYAQGDCKPLASIYGQDICAEDIMPSKKVEENIREYAKQSKQSQAQAVKDFKMSSLFGLLWEKGLIHKYGEDVVVPREREVKSYLKSFRKAIEDQNDMNEDMSAFITELLEENNYAPEDEQSLNAVVKQKQKSIMMFNMRDALPDEMRVQMEEGEYKMAEAMVKSWKIKKTLYEDYGGRVIIQKAGLEPLDAFQAFVKELEDSGEATIHDPAYKNVFKTIDKYSGKEHKVLPEDSEEIEDYFDSPSWAYDDDIAEKAFEQQKAEILAIPTIEPAAGEE
ncbi:MAG: hypothetical protein DHS20C02_16080 [Micavibrio sp.]|nr:MAG: hypothetical protein DHS20C02_16080 [Micavibrio sp.]